MRVLLIGKGAREHALAWKIRRSPLVTELLTWPGNAAINRLGTPLDLEASASLIPLIRAAKSAAVDLVVCGPEAPLAEGLADLCEHEGLPCFGPLKTAAELESSKAFAKDVMAKAGIPTAGYAVVTDEAEARRIAATWLREKGGVVLKASGLAAGKGVFVCSTEEELAEGLRHLYETDMRAAASTLVIEELMRGRECSYFTFLGKDGATGLGFAVDYKRLADGDEGPNTGGMGCYAPVPWLPEGAERDIVRLVVDPLIKELARRGVTYCGCLYVGLMWTEEGPKVVEFNVRLGDPEAEVLAAYDDRDWLALMAFKAGLVVPAEALAAATAPITHGEQAVAVVMASAGYPFGGATERAATLDPALFDLEAGPVKVFAASVKPDPTGKVATGTGRVLTLAARARTFEAARAAVYAKVDGIARDWGACRFRRDIGSRTT